MIHNWKRYEWIKKKEAAQNRLAKLIFYLSRYRNITFTIEAQHRQSCGDFYVRLPLQKEDSDWQTIDLERIDTRKVLEMVIKNGELVIRIHWG